MAFRLRGLPAEQFSPLFAMSDDELSLHGAVRRTADAREPGYPCRVSLTDSNPGDELILVRASPGGFAVSDALCDLRAQGRRDVRTKSMPYRSNCGSAR